MAEYGSNCIALLQLAKRTRVSIEVIPETAEGDIDIAALAAAQSAVHADKWMPHTGNQPTRTGERMAGG